MKKINYTFLILLLLCIFVIGCGGYHSKSYSGPELDKSEISIITTDDQFVTIAGVDGKKIDRSNSSNFFNALMWGGRFPRTISVKPGCHSIWPCYQNPYEEVCAEGWIDIETEHGESYIIKHERTKEANSKKIKFWIEKQEESDKTRHQKLLGL
ncbi:MAG: hypothetical protein HY755_09735 [Nitrospirae bacterium]|nr:hypothetical protein [Nitrospirota bacterium]